MMRNLLFFATGKGPQKNSFCGLSISQEGVAAWTNKTYFSCECFQRIKGHHRSSNPLVSFMLRKVTVTHGRRTSSVFAKTQGRCNMDMIITLKCLGGWAATQRSTLFWFPQKLIVSVVHNLHHGCIL